MQNRQQRAHLKEETGESAVVAEYAREYPRRFALAKSSGFAVYVRHEQRKGWSARLPLYVMWCARCEMHSVTHPAGYGRITCRECRHAKRVMTPQRFRDKIAPKLLPAVVLVLFLLVLLRYAGML